MKGRGAAFSEALLDWYDRNARPLPWRATKDPYAILVSEFMLQQTQVSTVIPYFERFMQRFPTLQALAAADEDEVLAAWKGLGYYRRARNVRLAAQAVLLEHQGRLPQGAEALQRLPGIGAYTAAAVASIAFGEPSPVLDGNVLRVMARVLAEDRPVEQVAVRRRMREHLEELIPTDRPGDFNQALMELGATLCTPANPNCGACPIARHCEARPEGNPERYPVKAKRARVRVERRTAGMLFAGERVLLVQRPADGLLGGLWEFPNVVGGGEEGVALLKGWVDERLGFVTGGWERLGEVEHRFSHLHWIVEVVQAELVIDSVAEAPLEPLAWVTPEELHEKAVSTAMQKVWALAANAGRAAATPALSARRGRGTRGSGSPRG